MSVLGVARSFIVRTREAFRAPFGSSRDDGELRAELNAHLAMQIDENQRRRARLQLRR